MMTALASSGTIAPDAGRAGGSRPEDNQREHINMAQFQLNPNVLKNVPLFSSFSDHQLAALIPAVQHRRFPRGSYVIRDG